MKSKVLCILSLIIILIGTLAFAQPARRLDPCGAGPTRSSRVDWPQFRFNLCHTGFNPYEFVLSPTTVVNLGPRWHYTTGFEVASSPAVANGVVYIGSDDNNM